jgi:hypothetical protein
VGGTIGVAIMGSVLIRRLDQELASNLPAEVRERAPQPLLEGLENPRILLDDGALERVRDDGFAPVFGADTARLFEQTVASMQEALATSITEVFLIAAALMAVAVVIILFLPEVPFRRAQESPAPTTPISDEASAAAPPSRPLRPAPQPSITDTD